MFSQKKKEATGPQKMSDPIVEPVPVPRVMLLDIDAKVKTTLDNLGIETFLGSLGKQVKIPNTTPGKGFCCLPNHVFPPNIHEFEIIVADLQNTATEEYSLERNQKTVVKGKKDLYLYCSYPTTVFDPRGLVSSYLADSISAFEKKQSLVILFASPYENTEYEIVSSIGRDVDTEAHEQHSNYDLVRGMLPRSENKTGSRVGFSSTVGPFRRLFEPHLPGIEYQIVFSQQTLWKNYTNVPDPDFVPLLETNEGRIVSFSQKRNGLTILLFPKIRDKDKFLGDLFSYLPDMFPLVFPFSKKGSWLQGSEYFLPNHRELIQTSIEIEKEHQRRTSEIAQKIEENKEKFLFLHKMLVETGDNLVVNVIVFLEWIGFANVVNCDLMERQLKEEDIQIETERGLLVIEVKGISGTSKDDECSQISKIKFRRAEERQRFDVFGLYLVNHQRMIPPLSRTNPPFTEMQVKDAIGDKRGLLTTWSLFNLYFEVESGVITKDEAKERFFDFGLVEFSNKTRTFAGKVKEVFKNGEVAVIDLVSDAISVGDLVFFSESERFRPASVVSVQVNGTNVETAKKGEVGLKLTAKVKLGMHLYKQ